MSIHTTTVPAFLRSGDDGTGDTQISGVNFNNYGQVQLQYGNLAVGDGYSSGSWTLTGGASLTLANGTFVFDTGSSFSYVVLDNPALFVAGGVGISAANLPSPIVISYATMTVQTDMTVQTLDFQWGTINGSGNLTVSQTMFWYYGTMSGSGSTTIAAGAKLYLLGDSPRQITDRLLNNAGQVGWYGGGAFNRIATQELFRNRRSQMGPAGPDMPALSQIPMYPGTADILAKATLVHDILYGLVSSPPPTNSIYAPPALNLENTFSGMPAVSRAALAAAYVRLYGIELQADINARLSVNIAPPGFVISVGFAEEIQNYYHYGQAEDPHAPPSTGMGFGEFLQMAAGTIEGLASGAWKAVEGLASFAWNLLWSPIQTIRGVVTGVAQLAAFFATGQFNEALQLIAPDLYRLLNEPQLSPHDRGFLFGKVAGEFGLPLLLGAVGPFVGKLQAVSNVIRQVKTLIGAIRNLPNIPGVKLLISKMKSKALSVWKGAYFQAKRTMYYFREGVLDSVEFLLGAGRKRGDILLKNGLRVECKSWTQWSELSGGIRAKRLAELRVQIRDYLRPTGSRMMIEFEGSIPAEVQTFLDGLANTYNVGQFGNRLIWTTVP